MSAIVGFLCATFVFSVPLWLQQCATQQPQRHREYKGCTEKSLNESCCVGGMVINDLLESRLCFEGVYSCERTNPN